MTDQSEWTGRVGGSWAAEWVRTDRSFRELTRHLTSRVLACDFTDALDIGCGAGEMVLKLGEARRDARIVGVDVSDELVQVARQRTRHLANVRIEAGDAAQWTTGKRHRPDLLLSRHGVMFFSDPISTFAHLRDQCAGPSRLVFTCFRERAENQWVQLLVSVFPDSQPSDPRAPGPFAFGDVAYVRDILRSAGWQNPRFEPIDYAMVVGEGDRAEEDAISYFKRIGPAARSLAAMNDKDRTTATDALAQLLAGETVDGIIALPAAAWLVSAEVKGRSGATGP